MAILSRPQSTCDGLLMLDRDGYRAQEGMNFQARKTPGSQENQEREGRTGKGCWCWWWFGRNRNGVYAED